jgi:hypothetical protein
MNKVCKRKFSRASFVLNISEKMAPNARIEKYAQEPVAYFLHK